MDAAGVARPSETRPSGVRTPVGVRGPEGTPLARSPLRRTRSSILSLYGWRSSYAVSSPRSSCDDSPTDLRPRRGLRRGLATGPLPRRVGELPVPLRQCSAVSRIRRWLRLSPLGPGARNVAQTSIRCR